MLHLVCPLFSRRAPFQRRRWPFASDTSPKMVFDCLGDMNFLCLFVVSFSGDLVLFVFCLPFPRLVKTDVGASDFFLASSSEAGSRWYRRWPRTGSCPSRRAELRFGLGADA